MYLIFLNKIMSLTIYARKNKTLGQTVKMIKEPFFFYNSFYFCQNLIYGV